ncbi:MAG TPA: ABC-2 transporter permease [Gemmatimonadales bacterium]|jgi:ABC-type transport system involved in multi-copper enzyme maturation permease subunit|nr:ABC-2 transporter permease [Gemmatimonadales bacterium]
MLWRKHWLQLRWLTLAGAVLLTVIAWITVDGQRSASFASDVAEIATALPGTVTRYTVPSPFTRYLEAHALGGPLQALLIGLALCIGVGGPGFERSGTTAVFTLSLPYTRRRLVLGRFLAAATVIALLSIFVVLLIAALAAFEGQGAEFPFAEALAIGVCLASGAIAVLSLSFLLANVTGNTIATLASAIVILIVVSMVVGAAYDRWWRTPNIWLQVAAPFDYMRLMGAKDFTATSRLPWPRIGAALALSGALAVATVAWVERQDF